MSDTSPVLPLPLIQPAQVQKHVTHNEALRVLDAVVHLAVIAADQNTPPAAPEVGARHIVAAPGSAVWAGHEDETAVYAEGGWSFVVPQPGWRAQVLSPAGAVVYDATVGWQVPAVTVQQAPQLGINATADATNRLSVSAPATLFNHEGAGHQLKLNKAVAGDTASLLYQTGFSGRTEMGLAVEDAFSLKVSADGATRTQALRAALDIGQIEMPQPVSMAGPVTGTAVQQGPHDTTAGRLLSVGAFGWGQDQGGQVNSLLNQSISLGVMQFSSSDPDKPFVTGGTVLVISYAHQWLS